MGRCFCYEKEVGVIREKEEKDTYLQRTLVVAPSDGKRRGFRKGGMNVVIGGKARLVLLLKRRGGSSFGRRQNRGGWGWCVCH